MNILIIWFYILKTYTNQRCINIFFLKYHRHDKPNKIIFINKPVYTMINRGTHSKKDEMRYRIREMLKNMTSDFKKDRIPQGKIRKIFYGKDYTDNKDT